MTDIVAKLRIKASMISLGEKISWGSDAAIMYEAADEIARLREELIGWRMRVLSHERN